MQFYVGMLGYAHQIYDYYLIECVTIGPACACLIPIYLIAFRVFAFLPLGEGAAA